MLSNVTLNVLKTLLSLFLKDHCSLLLTPSITTNFSDNNNVFDALPKDPFAQIVMTTMPLKLRSYLLLHERVNSDATFIQEHYALTYLNFVGEFHWGEKHLRNTELVIMNLDRLSDNVKQRNRR